MEVQEQNPAWMLSYSLRPAITKNNTFCYIHNDVILLTIAQWCCDCSSQQDGQFFSSDYYAMTLYLYVECQQDRKEKARAAWSFVHKDGGSRGC